MSFEEIAATAAKHLDNKAVMASSARLCYSDAIRTHDKDERASIAWMLKSLAYSVGVVHPDYLAVKACLLEPTQ
jgi:hypothetical protein